MAGAVGTDSPSFNAVNRGKRGIVLNLKSPLGREAFRRLASRADILIENYRPGVMASLGLDYATLAADHPALIYASISGYGQTGPDAAQGRVRSRRAGRLGVDVDHRRARWAAGEGRRADHRPWRGVVCAGAILAALYHRTRTGHGQYIDTSLVDAGVALSVWEATEYFGGQRFRSRWGPRTG